MMNKGATRKIKVCFVMPKAYPLFNPQAEGTFGGAEVDLYLLARELARDGDFEVHFVVADYGQEEREIREGVMIHKSLKLGQNPLAGAVRIWGALRRANADFYFLKTASPGVPLVWAFCRRYRRKFIYRTASIREINGAYLVENPLLGRLFLAALKRAAIVFTQNESDQRVLQEKGIENMMIPNGHPMPELKDKQREYILWVGRSESVKGPEKFLELARQMREEKFVMVCPPATDDGNYQKLQLEAGGITNLEFLPKVPFQKVADYFRSAKILVNTSQTEGFPNTFIQACQWAVPVVSLNVNPDGFLGRYGCGIHCKGSQEKMREAIKELDQEDRGREMGLKGRSYVEQHHNIISIIDQYKEIFLNASSTSRQTSQ